MSRSAFACIPGGSTGFRAVTAALLGALALASAGCSGNPHKVVYSDDRQIAKISADSCAIGGIVLRQGYELDDLAGEPVPPEGLTRVEQARLWSPVLESAFWSIAKHAPAVGWWEWSEAVPADALDRILYYQSRDTLVPPDLLRQCHQRMPKARWLYLVTIKGSIFMIDLYEGMPQHHAKAREIWLQLDIYDLKAGHSVWTSRLDYKGEGPDSPPSSSDLGGRGSGLEPWNDLRNNVATTVKSGPPLRPTLDQALVDLLGRVVPRGVGEVPAGNVP